MSDKELSRINVIQSVIEEASPAFYQLMCQALSVVYARSASRHEEQIMTLQLITFLRSGIDEAETTHEWLMRLDKELISSWRVISHNPQPEWHVVTELLKRTDPTSGLDMALTVFAGKVEGTGCVTLSTLHSAKGREFDVAIIFGVNDYDFPGKRDFASDNALREARRLFYVGVTRPRTELHMIYKEGRHSTWVTEFYHSSQQA